MTPSILELALQAHKCGLCVVPPRQDGSKRPYPGEWKQYQERLSTEAEIRHWYANGLTGLGLITGEVSGGLELLEFDDEDAKSAFIKGASTWKLGDLLGRIVKGYCEKTPSGGRHLLYRCKVIEGNQKLARRLKRENEKQHERDNVKVLIETRGERGFVITAPSDGRIHPTGNPYVLISGGFETIVTITPEEREGLHNLAALNRSDAEG